ncbi:hypothetical protein KR215_008971 [Drosophila sulfurigaster]|nr:hypothetical protein KR215_008971 [Drosophila sulfurigaster]
MTQVRLRKMQKQAAELVRDFYESLLLLTLGLAMQWNQWHVLRILNGNSLYEEGEAAQPEPRNWSAVFFTSGLLLTLLHYRPQWIKRHCSLMLRKFLLLPETFGLLFVVDYMLLSMWQPLFNFCHQIMNMLATSQGNWSRFVFHFCPSCSAWLINDAVYLMRFIISLAWFLLAIEASETKWRLAIDFLLLGQLPEVNRRRRRRLRLQY